LFENTSKSLLKKIPISKLWLDRRKNNQPFT
jgi:hypothetical protein